MFPEIQGSKGKGICGYVGGHGQCIYVAYVYCLENP